MKTTLSLTIACLAFAALCATPSDPSYSQESSPPQAQGAAVDAIPTESKIESLSVFKNGVVVVRERVDAPGPGKYAIDAPKTAVHGAFFVRSEAQVEATTSEIDAPAALEDLDGVNWVKDFRGLWFKAILPGEEAQTEVRILSAPDDSNENTVVRSPYGLQQNAPTKGLLLERKDGGVVYVANPAEVKSVSVDAEEFAKAQITRRKSQLVFDVRSDGPATIRLSYLCKDMAWAPQYQVTLVDGKTLSIAQSAAIVNDWRDIENAPVALCSGFPQIELKNASSPMSANATLSKFFESLNNSQNVRGDGAMLTQNSIVMGSVADSYAPAELKQDDSDSGIDVVSQNIGVRSFKKGSRTLISLDEGQTEYQRVVVWNIQSTRDFEGRLIESNPNVLRQQNYGQTTSGTKTKFKEPWDALVFSNPLKLPITTGPASIFMNDRFLAQNVLNWTNPKEETELPITKALSVRVKSEETERTDSGLNRASQTSASQPILETVRIGGSQFRKTTIDALVTITNQRAEETKVKLTRQFYGTLDEGSTDGFGDDFEYVTTSDSAGYGAYSLNPKREIRAEIDLKPNEMKTLKFAYQVYIRM